MIFRILSMLYTKFSVFLLTFLSIFVKMCHGGMAMDNFTELIKAKIYENYKSVRDFSLAVGVPQTTILSALKNGMGNTSFSTVTAICNQLNIDIDAINNNSTIDTRFIPQLNMYDMLDDAGKKKIDSIINDIKG